MMTIVIVPGCTPTFTFTATPAMICSPRLTSRMPAGAVYPAFLRQEHRGWCSLSALARLDGADIVAVAGVVLVLCGNAFELSLQAGAGSRRESDGPPPACDRGGGPALLPRLPRWGWRVGTRGLRDGRRGPGVSWSVGLRARSRRPQRRSQRPSPTASESDYCAHP